MSNTGGREDIWLYKPYGSSSSGNGSIHRLVLRRTSVCARSAEGPSDAHAATHLGCTSVTWRYCEEPCVGARAAQGNGLQSRTVAGSNPARRSKSIIAVVVEKQRGANMGNEETS